jgi:hypothetical protein
LGTLYYPWLGSNRLASRDHEEQTMRCIKLVAGGCLLILLGALNGVAAQEAGRKPNVLVIWGDGIGRDNISAYSLGIMGYQTPDIDRLAREGALFTDAYA